MSEIQKIIDFHTPAVELLFEVYGIDLAPNYENLATAIRANHTPDENIFLEDLMDLIEADEADTESFMNWLFGTKESRAAKRAKRQARRAKKAAARDKRRDARTDLTAKEIEAQGNRPGNGEHIMDIISDVLGIGKSIIDKDSSVQGEPFLWGFDNNEPEYSEGKTFMDYLPWIIGILAIGGIIIYAVMQNKNK